MTFEESIKNLKEILQINSVENIPKPGMPFGEGPYLALEKSLEILSKNGFTTKNLDGYCGYGDIGQGELFGILCHLDVVPAGDGWIYPPFSATEIDNKIYARGALDDKSPFIAILYAISSLLEEGYTPNKRIRIILGCNEESGWGCMDHYKKHAEMPSIGFSPDADFPVINCEKGIFHFRFKMQKPKNIISLTAGNAVNMVPDKAICKLSTTEEITVLGKSAHGSTPEKGENALLNLLKKLGSTYSALLDIYNKFHSTKGELLGLAISDKESGDLSINLGTAKTTETEIVFEVDIRHPISYTKDYIVSKLQQSLGYPFEETYYHSPLYVPEDSELVTKLLAAYNKVMGTNSKPIAIGGGTYARVLPMGVAFGPCFPNGNNGIHCPNEYIDLDEYKKCVEIYKEALKSLCFYK